MNAHRKEQDSNERNHEIEDTVTKNNNDYDNDDEWDQVEPIMNSNEIKEILSKKTIEISSLSSLEYEEKTSHNNNNNNTIISNNKHSTTTSTHKNHFQPILDGNGSVLYQPQIKLLKRKEKKHSDESVANNQHANHSGTTTDNGTHSNSKDKLMTYQEKMLKYEQVRARIFNNS